MLKVSLILVLFAATAFAESVRETETWMPPKAGESNDDLDSSGDFIFHSEKTTFSDDDDDDYNDEEEEEDGYWDFDEMSGSGDDETITDEENMTGEIDNRIQETERSGQPRPTINDIELVRQNEVGHYPSVQLSHAGEQNIFNKTEVLAVTKDLTHLHHTVLHMLLSVHPDEDGFSVGSGSSQGFFLFISGSFSLPPSPSA